MDPERMIVQMGNVAPQVSRGKTKKIIIAAGILTAVIAILFLAPLLSGSQAKPLVKNPTIAKVETVDLVSSTEASGTVVVKAQISVVSPQEGYADQVLVKEGDTVKKNSVLAALSVPDLVEQRDDLISELAVARLALADLTNENAFSIQTLETSLARAEVDLAEAKEDLKEKEDLLALKSSRKSDYDTAVKTLRTQQQKRDDLAAQLSNQRTKNVLSLEKQRATVAQLQVSLKRVEDNIEEARIKSPLGGEVLSITSKLLVPGSLIEKNSALMTIADRRETFIDFEVNEQYVSLLKPGSEMSVTVSAKTFMAEVTQVGKVAAMASDGLTSTVSVRAKPKSDTPLTPGASAVATLNLGIKKGVLTLPRGAYLTTGGQKYVYKVQGNTAIKTAVTFGEIQSTKAEILSGLTKGDRVIVSSYQDFIDANTVEIKEGDTK